MQRKKRRDTPAAANGQSRSRAQGELRLADGRSEKLPLNAASDTHLPDVDIVPQFRVHFEQAFSDAALEDKRAESTHSIDKCDLVPAANEMVDNETSKIIADPKAPDAPAQLEPSRPVGWTTRKKLLLSLMLVTQLTVSCSFSLLAPFFPTEAEQRKKLSKSQIGFIFGCFQMSNLIMAPLFGKYLSLLGVKYLYISGLFLSGGCLICFGILDRAPAGPSYLALCILCRALGGVGSSASVTSGFAIVAQEFPHAIATATGLLEMVNGAGFGLGPFVGGALYEVGGFVVPFAAVGTTMMLMSVMYIFIFPSIKSARRAYSGSLLSLIRIPAILIMSMTVFFAFFGLAFLDVGLGPHLKTFNLSVIVTGVIFMTAPILYALTAPIWGWLVDRGHAGRIMIVVGNLVCVTGMVLIGPVPIVGKSHLWLTILAIVILGIGFACSQVPVFRDMLMTARAHGFPDELETHGLISGVYNFFYPFGAFLGAVVGGIISDRIGFRWTCSVIALMVFTMVMVMIIFMLISRHLSHKRKSQDEQDKGSEEIPLK